MNDESKIVEILSSKEYFQKAVTYKNPEDSLLFLAEASTILSSSLNYQTTLSTLAKLAVPKIADWCAIDMLDKYGTLQLLVIAHVDPEKVVWAKKLREQMPTNMNDQTGSPKVVRTGRSEMYSTISEEVLLASAKNEQVLQVLKELKLSSVMIVPIKTRDKILGVISFVTTEESNRHYIQADLIFAEDLAHRAALAIENAQLYQQAKKEIEVRKRNETKLKELEKRKDEFISIASHELKTPVTSIKIFTQLLQKQFVKEGHVKAITYLGKMSEQIDNLTDLISDLLDLSKIQAGKLHIEETLFDINALVREIVETYQPTTKANIIIQDSISKKIYGDRNRIGQVLINLLINAIKYSARSKKIIIALSENKVNVIIKVQDFGIRIKKENQKKIFERFYQVSEPREKTFPGLGIGLYISKQIIKQHNGKLWVESMYGQGSSFIFSIPIKT